MRISIFIFLFLSLSSIGLSQKVEITSCFGYSVNGSRMFSTFKEFDHSKLSINAIKSFNIQIKYLILPKFDTHIATYFDYNLTELSHNIYNLSNTFDPASQIFKTVRIQSNFPSAGLGVHQTLQIISDKLELDFYLRVIYNFKNKDKQLILSDSIFQSTSHYQYQIEASANNFRKFSFEGGLDLKFRLSSKMRLNFGLRLNKITVYSDFEQAQGSVLFDGTVLPYNLFRNGYGDNTGLMSSMMLTPRIGLSIKL
jgi:hypothetical protein